MSCIDITSIRDYKMATKAAQMASRRDQPEKMLLDFGINPDCRLDTGSPGLTATYLAAANGHVKTLKLLLDSGFQGSFSPGFSPLYGAATNGHTDCIRLLIKSAVWGNDQGERCLEV